MAPNGACYRAVFQKVQAQARSEHNLLQPPAAVNLKIGYWNMAVEALKLILKVGPVIFQSKTFVIVSRRSPAAVD